MYPPPRLPRRACHPAITLPKHFFLSPSFLGTPSSGETPWERFPGRDSLGVPPWERLPGRASLGETPWERFPRRDSLERLF